MNLEQLQSFVEVARIGHFTRAAAHLHLAQPSLSRQISTLESDLGAELFHRARGNITLTDAGESLLPLARRMLADADTVRHEMQELAGLAKGRVRLGATPTLCISLVAEVLSSFHAAHPGIDLHLSERGSRGLLDELAGGTLDLALVTTSEETPGTSASLQAIPLLTEELVVAVAANSPLLENRGSLTLTELAELPQITFHESYDLRATTMQAFREAGLSPKVVLEGSEMDAVHPLRGTRPGCCGGPRHGHGRPPPPAFCQAHITQAHPLDQPCPSQGRHADPGRPRDAGNDHQHHGPARILEPCHQRLDHEGRLSHAAAPVPTWWLQQCTRRFSQAKPIRLGHEPIRNTAVLPRGL